MKTATRFLEQQMVGDIERITGGRYRRVAVDDKTLDIRLHAPGEGRLGRRPRRSARARSTSSTSRPGSGSSGSSPAIAGRR